MSQSQCHARLHRSSFAHGNETGKIPDQASRGQLPAPCCSTADESHRMGVEGSTIGAERSARCVDGALPCRMLCPLTKRRGLWAQATPRTLDTCQDAAKDQHHHSSSSASLDSLHPEHPASRIKCRATDQPRYVFILDQNNHSGRCPQRLLEHHRPNHKILQTRGILLLFKLPAGRSLRHILSQQPLNLDFVPLFQFVVFTLISCPPNILWQELLEATFPGYTYQSAPKAKVDDHDQSREAEKGSGGMKLNVANTCKKFVLDQTVGATVNTLLFIVAIGALKGRDVNTILGDCQKVSFTSLRHAQNSGIECNVHLRASLTEIASDRTFGL